MNRKSRETIEKYVKCNKMCNIPSPAERGISVEQQVEELTRAREVILVAVVVVVVIGSNRMEFYEFQAKYPVSEWWRARTNHSQDVFAFHILFRSMCEHIHSK